MRLEGKFGTKKTLAASMRVLSKADRSGAGYDDYLG